MYKFTIIRRIILQRYLCFPQYTVTGSGLHEILIYKQAQCDCKACSLVQRHSNFHMIGLVYSYAVCTQHRSSWVHQFSSWIATGLSVCLSLF